MRNTVYLQRGGGNYCRRNCVTVTPCTCDARVDGTAMSRTLISLAILTAFFACR